MYLRFISNGWRLNFSPPYDPAPISSTYPVLPHRWSTNPLSKAQFIELLCRAAWFSRTFPVTLWWVSCFQINMKCWVDLLVRMEVISFLVWFEYSRVASFSTSAFIHLFDTIPNLNKHLLSFFWVREKRRINVGCPLAFIFLYPTYATRTLSRVAIKPNMNWKPENCFFSIGF